MVINEHKYSVLCTPVLLYSLPIAHVISNYLYELELGLTTIYYIYYYF